MKIAIIGLGLIGGSLAKSIKKYTEHICLGLEQDAKTVSKALAEGAIDEVIQAGGLAQADLTIVCLHPEATIDFILKQQEDFRSGSVVIDVCGVKQSVVQSVQSALADRGVIFVGAHPMAGREFSGYDYAVADLYQGASFIMTPTADVPESVLEMLDALAHQLGFARVVRTTAAVHDQTIAFTSQLAHVVSNGYIKSPTLQNESGFSAGSFLDLTRVAKLNEQMWTELFMMNREPLLFEVTNIIEHLRQYQQALADNDAEMMCQLLREGRILKEESLKVR